MKKIILASATAILTSIFTYGEIPEGYYTLLKGKSGDALKEAVKTVAHPSEYTRITYGPDSWGAFLNTDVRIVNGMTIWWDMYSNKIVTTDSNDGMNIEHSVANSWFGAKNAKDAYADLFHLNPSNEAANNQKGSLPLGEVATVAWQNELVKTGTPKAGTAGGSAKVFEPADEYKGDFARAYLYIFTVYDEENWKTDQTMYTFSDKAELNPWAVEMLCRWAKNDPVDSKEIKRNEEIYKIQKNRNPFIDYPELIDYIWGSKKGETFSLENGAEAIDRPAEPVFTSRWMTGVNTYSSRWWEPETARISHSEGNLWVSINGGEYQQYGPGVSIPASKKHGENLTLSAYTETENHGYTLRSSIATLTLTGRDPEATDYTEAIYLPVATTDALLPQSYYIILSASNGHIMGHEGGTSSSSFMPDAGMVMTQGENICHLPTNAAVVRFQPSEGGKYLLEVFDAMNNKSKGYWNVGGSGNKNTLKANTGTVATVGFKDDGTAEISFEGGKSLQYNKTQPRFTNYSSKQGAVKLARFSEFYDLETGIDDVSSEDEEGCIAIDGNNIILPDGWTLYELNGRTSAGRSLEPGIYIARSKRGKTVKIMIQR